MSKRAWRFSIINFDHSGEVTLVEKYVTKEITKRAFNKLKKKHIETTKGSFCFVNGTVSVDWDRP